MITITVIGPGSVTARVLLSSGLVFVEVPFPPYPLQCVGSCKYIPITYLPLLPLLPIRDTVPSLDAINECIWYIWAEAKLNKQVSGLYRGYVGRSNGMIPAHKTVLVSPYLPKLFKYLALYQSDISPRV